MGPLRISIASAFTPMGGGSKLAALLFRHLDRRLFEPRLVSAGEFEVFADEYGIPADRRAVFDVRDGASIAAALAGSDIVVALVGSANNVGEYDALWRGASAAGVRMRVLYCILALGNAEPGMADLILSCSMETLLRGRRFDRCHAVYPALPRHETSGRRLREELGIPKEAFVVAHAASEDSGDFYRAAAAFTGRGNVVFLSALGRTERWPVPSNVRFCGFLRQRDMPALYDAADVVLHARTESFGYSVYQALAAGTPVVALWTTSNNAFAEAIWPGGGYLARDFQGLVAAVEHVLGNRPEALGRAAAARARVDRLVPEEAVPRFEALLLRGLREKGACPAALADARPAKHWPGPGDVDRWAQARLEIEDRLRRESFV